MERLEEQREKAIYRPEKKIRLTYIGRLVEVKGVHLLIKAIYALKNQGVHVSLTIVGDGEYRTVLEKEASELGVADSIRFLSLIHIFCSELLYSIANHHIRSPIIT